MSEFGVAPPDPTAHVCYPVQSRRSGVLLGTAVISQDLGTNWMHDRSGMNEEGVVAL
jgi:hypothetical protein